MKVVINVCYGGWGLSEAAEKLVNKALNENPSEFGFEKEVVKLIEEFGSEFVSGPHSKLEIVEVPDGLGYSVSEYDGMESIETYLEVTSEELKNGLSEEKLSLLKYTMDLKVIC